MQFKTTCKLTKKEKLAFGCQLHPVSAYTQGTPTDWFVFQCNTAWQIFTILYFPLFTQCGGYLDDPVGTRSRLGSVDCQPWRGGYFLVTGHCDRWSQWRPTVHVHVYKRWEHTTECLQFYLKPPPIAAPTTILRQPLNVLYRTPVEAVKLNSKFK